MIEASFRALLMAAIGGAPLAQDAPPDGMGCCNIAVRGRIRDRGRTGRDIRGTKQNPLSQNHFAMRLGHAALRGRRWTTGLGFVAG